MNRTDRLLAIVLELQGKGKLRAEDLAATFEISKRTIYRDIQALSESGVPLVAVPGQGYALVEGYFLPPLSFTTDEATMLLLGSDFMAQSFDAQYRAAAQSASRKIEGVLKAQVRDEARYLRENIRFVASNSPEERGSGETLAQLRRAIIERATVRFHYYPRYREGNQPPTSREADPHALSYVGGAIYLTAYDHTRQAMRNFRLDRIDNLTLLPKRFTRRGDSRLERPRLEERNIIVRVLFDHEVARWAQEGRSFFTINEEQTPDGLLVTLAVRQESEVLGWLLNWGRHVRVLEPQSLQRMLVEEAEAIAQNYHD
ncbi:MAG: YafY family transcriptional regulator [Candidatus Chloroheliales bacterium]|nr:MAG: YafY family transcriptional regulator [Chloroflexota bacterium]